ncbi:MAG: hypothetical protein OXH93_06850 [Caldilineaceae bacterium]|nr:hypothetical protein [Caldilineaceae bacterium]
MGVLEEPSRGGNELCGCIPAGLMEIRTSALGIRGCPLAGAERMGKRDRSANPRRTERRAALRHITEESGHEVECARTQADDAAIELLSPLLAQAVDSGKPVDIPGGYWIRAEVKEVATLAAGIGHANTGAGVLVSLAASPGPSHKLPVLLVSAAGLETRLRTAALDRGRGKENTDLVRIAGEIDDLERRVAWTWLELWERHHRQMGGILRAILEDERAYLSSAYRREL